MLGSSDVIAFVATPQPERALEFYRDTLGLTFVADDGFALTFDANGTPLRIAKVARMTPAPATVLGWRVKDIAAAVAGLAGRGVRFERYDGLDQNASGVWRSPGGGKVAWFRDPDGNVLSLTED